MPTAKNKPAPSVIELTTRQFRNLVEPVLPLAGKDDMLPVLTTLLIRASGDTITATATDRFRVGISRIPANEPLTTPVKFMIRTADVKRILSVFKGSRYDDPSLSFTISTPNGVGNGTALEVNSTAGFDGLAGASLMLTAPDGEFPKVDQILTDALASTEERVDHFGVNAAFLSDFKAAVRDGASLVIRPGTKAKKAIIVACGDHFIGAIMPRPIAGAAPVAELGKAWATILPAKTEEAA